MSLPYVIPPAGVSAAGFFVPGVVVASPEHPPAILADAIDELTGELTSLFAGPHPVDATVQTAFRTLQGSGAAVVNVGHRYDKIRKKTDRTARELHDEAERVLRPFVDRGDIEVETILEDVENQGFDGAAQLIRYRNRVNGLTEDLKR